MGAWAIVVLARTQRIRDIKDMHMGNHKKAAWHCVVQASNFEPQFGSYLGY